MAPGRTLIALTLALLVGDVGLTGCTGCGEDYSDGERVGPIVKFSKKGLLIKSREGQMNLGGMTSDGQGHMVANTWEFTVRNPAMVGAVEKAMNTGKPRQVGLPAVVHFANGHGL